MSWVELCSICGCDNVRDVLSDVIRLVMQQTPHRLHEALDRRGNSAVHMAAASGTFEALVQLLQGLHKDIQPQHQQASRPLQQQHQRQQHQRQQQLYLGKHDHGLTPCGIKWNKFLNPNFTFIARRESRQQSNLSPEHKSQLLQLVSFRMENH